MTNSAAFSAADLRTIFGERAIVPDFHASVGVCTDSRALQPGSIFVALKGERFDAHDHIETAIMQGCVAVVFEERWLDTWNQGLAKTFASFARVVVPDTLVALAQLARYHRDRFDIPVLAVAGANGKTTTKELAAHVFTSKWLTLKTEANYNNRVGTPLTLLQLTKFHQAAVIEIGTNEPGEIEVLSEMVNPSIGLITNIGEEHLEKLIDLDGVEREETALFRHCAAGGARALVNIDDERLRSHVQSLPLCYRFATDDNAEPNDVDLHATIRFDDELHPALTIHARSLSEPLTCTLQTIGFATALNAAAALASADVAGIPLEQACSALESFEAPAVHGYARMQIQTHAALPSVRILNDCYNANPSSMRMALSTLKAFNAERRIALLGDMRELGAATSASHDEIVSRALRSADILILLGTEMHSAAARVVDEAQRSRIFLPESPTAAAATLTSLCRAGDVILLKGSRGMALERVLQAL